MSDRIRLTSGRLLAGNVIWNIAGAGLPLLVGLWAIPELIDGLGKERFGLLTIIWMGIGYFSLFDFGIGRALTMLVAERLGKGRTGGLPRLICIGLRLMLLLGILAALVVISLTPVLIEQVLQIPEELHDEGKMSFWILAFTLPFVVSTAGYIGVLQAYQRFRTITAVRVPLGVVNFVGPVLVLPLTDSLIATTIILSVARLGAWAAYYLQSRRYQKEEIQQHMVPLKLVVMQLLSYGSWITVSNVVSPMMRYFDRLLISGLLGLVAVTYYTTPYEIVTRLWIFPNAIADVIFPALTAALVSDIIRARNIYITATFAQSLIMSPIIVLLTIYAPELLSFWVGEEFAINSAGVLRWLALGVYINCFARMPFALIQSQGRPDITAKLHLAELPLYFFALWWMTLEWGIAGAAISWTIRIIVDTLLLYFFASRQVHSLKRIQYKIIMAVFVTSVILITTWFIHNQVYKALVSITLLLIIFIFLVIFIHFYWRRYKNGALYNVNK